MAMNRVQFQEGLSLSDFLAQFGTDEQCEAHLIELRWPNGFVCNRCQCRRFSKTHNGRRLWECLGCGYQCSSIVGTVFEQTKLPLHTWFLGIYLMTQSKNAISALELKRQLGISYPAAWLMKHKILETMFQREEVRVLDGRVELDDAYLGGERTGDKRGRGSPNKVPFVAAVQTSAAGKPQLMRLSRVAGFTKEAIELWAAQAIAPTAQIVSDALPCFSAVAAYCGAYERHLVGGGAQAVKRVEFKWVNTMLGNLKTALSGTYHAFNYNKYGHRYLAEFAYRFNRRYDLKTIVPRFLSAAMKTEPQPLKKLRFSEGSC
jgi:transposase-like protein